MKKILVLLANGFEEIEVVVPVDIWRRFGMQVTLAMVDPHPSLVVMGQQGVAVKADISIDDIYAQDFDMIFLPGGEGHKLVAAYEKSMALIESFVVSSKVISAICAAPIILANAGFLAGRKATIYPTFKQDFEKKGVLYEESDVVIDGQFITSRGAGTAAKFAFAVAATVDREKAQELVQQMQFD